MTSEVAEVASCQECEHCRRCICDDPVKFKLDIHKRDKTSPGPTFWQRYYYTCGNQATPSTSEEPRKLCKECGETAMKHWYEHFHENIEDYAYGRGEYKMTLNAITLHPLIPPTEPDETTEPPIEDKTNSKDDE